jgi:hypothetical protein
MHLCPSNKLYKLMEEQPMGNMCKESCESKLRTEMSRLVIQEKRSCVMRSRRVAKSGQVYILVPRGGEHERDKG